jgi:tRNA threonylcarbamoyladenosine biosynthesis protein TsaE
MIIETRSAQETFQLGKELGEKAYPGQVFTQGFAAGLGITEPVNSPTFTIVQVYEEGRLPFYHFDVYRIGDVEEMDEVGFEDYVMGEGVSLIEWANLIEEILPQKRRSRSRRIWKKGLIIEKLLWRKQFRQICLHNLEKHGNIEDTKKKRKGKRICGYWQLTVQG